MKKLWEKYHSRNSEEYYFTPARMATMKEKKKSKYGWRVEKLEASYIASWKVKWCNHDENVGSCSKVTHRVNLAISFLAIYSKELKRCFLHEKTYMNILAEYLSVTANKGKNIFINWKNINK